MIEFDRAAFRAALQRAFSENGLKSMLSYEKAEQFERLTERLLTENEKYNLTAIRDVEKIALLHYADCVSAAHAFPKGARVVDVGCGAGFPSLPLALVRPDLTILALDSTEKKVKYVNETAAMLGLTNIEARVMRAEDGANDPTLREAFDIATARAVAELRVLTELCLPYVKVGGEMIAMKGKQVTYEAASAKKAISLLGGRLLSVDETPLKSSTLGGQSHALVRIKKEKKSPANYPRPYTQISKKPL